jgi:hypothetical protein
MPSIESPSSHEASFISSNSIAAVAETQRTAAENLDGRITTLLGTESHNSDETSSNISDASAAAVVNGGQADFGVFSY